MNTNNNTNYSTTIANLRFAGAILLEAANDDVSVGEALEKVRQHCLWSTAHKVHILIAASKDPLYAQYPKADAFGVLADLEVSGNLEQDLQWFLSELASDHIQQVASATDPTLQATTRAVVRHCDKTTLQHIADEQ